MKIAIYAICGGDESPAIIHRFLKSCDEADWVTVAQTKVDWKTWHDLHQGRAHVHNITIAPFRFDDARNAALALVPADIDICVAMDMDEVLQPGWRDKLIAAWVPGTTNAWITFDTITQGRFLQNNRVHARHGWRWRHPCHEALVQSINATIQPVEVPEIVMEHHPDTTKPRPNYLELLAWGQWEDPTSLRMMHYYGRELMFNGFYRVALEQFRRYLELEPETPFPHERALTEGYVIRCEGYLTAPSGSQ